MYRQAGVCIFGDSSLSFNGGRVCRYMFGERHVGVCVGVEVCRHICKYMGIQGRLLECIGL